MNEIEVETKLDTEAIPVRAQLIILQDCKVAIKTLAEEVTFKRGETIEIQFNPTDYSLSSKSNVETTKTGEKVNKVPNHIPVEGDSLSVNFIYDAAIQKVPSLKNSNNDYSFSPQGDLYAGCLKKFRALAYVVEKRPPYVNFVFGSFSFIGYVSSVDIKCTRFQQDGKVLRAEISLRINEEYLKDIQVAKREQAKPKEENFLYMKDLLNA